MPTPDIRLATATAYPKHVIGAAEMNTQGEYLDLLKKTLTGYVYPDFLSHSIVNPHDSWRLSRKGLATMAAAILAKKGLMLLHNRRFGADARAEGRVWPMLAYTMIGLKRLNNVQFAIETVAKENVPGDIVECGVWRGGCAIFMRAVMKSTGLADRALWCADSFEGLPRPDVKSFPADAGHDLSNVDYLSVSLERVQRNFEIFGLLDDRVRFIKGWFKDTLPTVPIQRLAVLRADGDLYESTTQILESLYDKVSSGGFVIIDDYHSWPSCKQAVTDFRKQRNITATIHDIDQDGVYWRVG